MISGSSVCCRKYTDYQNGFAIHSAWGILTLVSWTGLCEISENKQRKARKSGRAGDSGVHSMLHLPSISPSCSPRLLLPSPLLTASLPLPSFLPIYTLPLFSGIDLSSPAGFRAEPQPETNFVHISFKCDILWH